jgi:hypothetical protein
MPDVESMSALNVVIFHLCVDVQTALRTGRLHPGEVVDHSRGGLASGIGDLHVRAKTSLRHLALAAER